MTCLQTCPVKPNDPIGTKRSGLARSFMQSLADLWVAIVYSGLAGVAVLAIDASDGGLPTLMTAVLCCAVPPVTTLLLIVMEAFVRHILGSRAAR